MVCLAMLDYFTESFLFSNLRTMKLEYEQKLAEEKTNYGILEGQLMVCLTSQCACVYDETSCTH